MPKNGVVKPKNKGYGMFRFVDDNGVEQFRKPNARQRKRILTYYIRRRSGRIMKVHEIAKAFNVSDRTIQKLIKELEIESVIRREPVYDETGFQKANKIIFIGDKKRLTGEEPSIDKVYDNENPMRLRDFEWDGFWEYKDDIWLFFDNLSRTKDRDDWY